MKPRWNSTFATRKKAQQQAKQQQLMHARKLNSRMRHKKINPQFPNPNLHPNLNPNPNPQVQNPSPLWPNPNPYWNPSPNPNLNYKPDLNPSPNLNPNPNLNPSPNKKPTFSIEWDFSGDASIDIDGSLPDAIADAVQGSIGKAKRIPSGKYNWERLGFGNERR